LRAAFPDATGKLLVLLHGSCMADRGWLRRGHDHGLALARDLGYTPVYLHYNSGLHVGVNGAELAPLLAALVAAWPRPLDELALLCHSMGGLVARSAMHLAPSLPVRRVVFLGTPHHGSPLERSGNIVTTVLGVSAYTGPIGRLSKLRSAGITDLRHGAVEAPASSHDRFGHGPDARRPVPLPPSVACYAIAASLTSSRLTSPLGDGLVPVESALGRHPDARLSLGIPDARCHVAHGLGHLDLLDHADVYAHLVKFLSEPLAR
ncbi:MAG: alpha/beta hydrolase, partial [Myxococcota bacterium]